MYSGEIREQRKYPTATFLDVRPRKMSNDAGNTHSKLSKLSFLVGLGRGIGAG
jgi:hypothetical protein